jgi:uncharacterized protein YjbJ (UPF0337 family)
MKGSTDVVKGRIEEAAGALVGNDKLRAKGQKDQLVGHAKQAVEKGVQQATKAAQKAAKTIVDRVKKSN